MHYKKTKEPNKRAGTAQREKITSIKPGRKRVFYAFYATYAGEGFYAFYAWWISFPQSGALAEGTGGWGLFARVNGTKGQGPMIPSAPSASLEDYIL
jgi:hypothetical protein